MSNTKKNGCTISHNNKTITLTRAYAKKANTPGTKEFKELANLHKAYPDYDIVMRTATITADKNTHDGLTIEMMEKIIESDDLVILGNRYEVQLCAIELNASCIIACLNAPISKNIPRKTQIVSTFFLFIS